VSSEMGVPWTDTLHDNTTDKPASAAWNAWMVGYVDPIGPALVEKGHAFFVSGWHEGIAWTLDEPFCGHGFLQRGRRSNLRPTELKPSPD